MAVDQPIERDMYSGESKTPRWTIVKDDGTREDMTGWTFKLVVETAASVDVFNLTTGFVLSSSLSDAILDRVALTLTTAQTALLAAAGLTYALWRTNAGSEAVLAFGDILAGVKPS